MMLAIPLLVAGCSGDSDDIREIEIHIGYSADRTKQYVEPKEIRVDQGDRVRFIITNDDKSGAADAFHDVAFRYANYGLIEHEVPAGTTVTTCLPQAMPNQDCPEGKDFFVASEKGSFKIWCEVGPLGKTNSDGTPQTRHERMGMWGTLIVE